MLSAGTRLVFWIRVEVTIVPATEPCGRTLTINGFCRMNTEDSGRSSSGAGRSPSIGGHGFGKPLRRAVNLLSGIRLVVFDAVGTLIHPSPSVADVYCQCFLRHTGERVARKAVQTALSAALNARNAAGDFSTDESREEEFWRQLVADLCPLTAAADACFEELFAHFGEAAHWCCCPDVSELLTDLCARGIRVAIGSNFDRRLHAVCDGFPELCSISDRFISSEIGWRKPAVEFFQAVARSTGVPPSRTVVIGDDFANDCIGGLEAGCRTVWLNQGSAQLPAADCKVRRITSLRQLVTEGHDERR